MGVEDEDSLALANTMAGDVGTAPTMSGPAQVTAEPGRPNAELTAEHPNRYEIGEEIGRGGMGRVFVAKDRHLGREVAVKELLGQVVGANAAGLSVGVVTRFLREARVTGQLEHPGIVPVHELGQRADGSLYYTMKRIRGRSFKAALDEASTMSDRLKLITPFRDVCETVAYAHSRGVVHRDLKPDNVMVGAFGETLLVDWGLAKARGEDDAGADKIEELVDLIRRDAASTVHGHAIGTPAYMSPEQARGELASIDERSDVWSLGAMLFEILTGRPPHEGDRALEVLTKVLEERPPKVLEVAKDAPPELAAIADRALLRDRSSRYPGAAEVASEIAAYQEGRQVHAYSYSAWEMVTRFVGRHRAASVAAGSILLAVLVATALVFQSYRSEQRARAEAEERRDVAVFERHRAQQGESDAQVVLTRALIVRAEQSLDRGDPGAAAVFAAGAMSRDPAYDVVYRVREPDGRRSPSAEERERVARAVSAYLDAEDRRRLVFVRRIEGASSTGRLSPDGRTLVFPAAGELRVEDLSGSGSRRLPLSADRVLGFLDADRVLLEGEQSGVYRLSDGQRLQVLPPGARAISVSATRVAIATVDAEVIVLERPDMTEIARWSTGRRGATLVAWVSGERLLETGAPRVVVRSPPGYGTSARYELPSVPYAMAVSPSGERAAIGFADPGITLVDVGEALTATSIDVEGWVTGLCWVDDQLFVSAEGGSRVVLFDAETRRALDTLRTPMTIGQRVRSHGSSGYLVALPVQLSDRLVEASVFRWSRDRQRLVRPVGDSIRALVLDPPRSRVLVATLRRLLSFSRSRGGLAEAEVLASLPEAAGSPVTMAVAADGAAALVTNLGSVLLLEPGEGSMRTVYEGDARQPCLFGVAFQPDSDVLFFGDEAGLVHRYLRSRSSALPPLEGHEGAVCGLSFTPDGSLLATASLDGSVRFWDPGRTQSTRTIEPSSVGITDVAFSPDGERLAVADQGGDLAILRRSDASVDVRFTPHADWINRVVWTRDGQTLITASDDRTVRVLGADGQSLHRIVRTSGIALALGVTASGAHLFYPEGSSLVRLPLDAPVDVRDPDALLRLAEGRAGVRLEGLELETR